MEWDATWQDPLTTYLQAFDELIGDQRTRRTLQETIRGIIGAGSLICQQIAVHSAVRSLGKKGWQRVARLASGGSHATVDPGCGASDRAVVYKSISRQSEVPSHLTAYEPVCQQAGREQGVLALNCFQRRESQCIQCIVE